MEKLQVEKLVKSIHNELLPKLKIESVNPHDPIEVRYLPEPWELLGRGNYAVVVLNPGYPELVIKIYAPDRPGFEEEVEVYRRLGSHPAFSECFYAENGFLVLKRLHGITLYDCMNLGLPIPRKVIEDIDTALDYARDRGLFPHDIHGRNVMMHEGKGLVVDISDFLDQETCYKWENLKKAYYWLYLPIFYPTRLKVPYFMLDGVRKSYRMLGSFGRKNKQVGGEK
ncbi:MAG: serine/threonine-protein kinase [Cyanobacteria bacterium P01_A01_bin.45]